MGATYTRVDTVVSRATPPHLEQVRPRVPLTLQFIHGQDVLQHTDAVEGLHVVLPQRWLRVGMSQLDDPDTGVAQGLRHRHQLLDAERHAEQFV